MKIVERLDRLLDRFINALYWENSSDLYMKRCTELFYPPQSKSIEGHHAEKTINEIVIAELIYWGLFRPARPASAE